MKGAEKPPAKGSRRRRLSEEDIDIWLSVAATVTRRPGAVLPSPLAPSVPLLPEPPGPQVPRVMPYAAPYIARPAVPVPKMASLDRRIRQKLSRGRIKVDAAIDLHGFRQAEAHIALRHFLYGCQREGARIVLVVTGKGSRGEAAFTGEGATFGVLKRAVPLWLSEPDLRAIVVGFEDAGRTHGGTGALYVRLRRLDRG